jgi:hypothetical protein
MKPLLAGWIAVAFIPWASARTWIPAAVQNFPMSGEATLTGTEDDKEVSVPLPVKTGQLQMQGEEIVKGHLVLDDKDKSGEGVLQITKAELLTSDPQTHINTYQITAELKLRDHAETTTMVMTMHNNAKDFSATGTLQLGKDAKTPSNLKLNLSGSKVPPENSW